MSYVLNTSDDQRAMLAQIGASSIEDLFSSIPASLRLQRPLEVPPAMSEMELTQHVTRLAGQNDPASEAVCFLGGGSYDHFIPAVVDTVAGRSEFYTAYTPYQAEASQGSLQAFFEFQTLICQLTGMDVANASVYEAGSGLAEAVVMASAITGRRGSVLVGESVHPEYRRTLGTYLANLEPHLKTIPTPEGSVDPDRVKEALDDDTICVILQHPNFFGSLEEVREVARLCQARGALFIAAVDPISLGLLERPGSYGADIVVAEGQSLGSPMSYGGPYLGILACREAFVRKMPGRLVGQTVDRNGKRCWVLTLQTREQHIRREKATSNICTNQGLYALRAAVYLATLGPQGVRETATLCLQKAHHAARLLAEVPGVRLKFPRPFFKEFTVELEGSVPFVLERLRQEGIHAGLHLGRWYPDLEGCLGIAVTEKRTLGEIEALAAGLRRCVSQ